MAAGPLGTTALWPNFFLESISVHQKGRTDQSDLPEARTDLAVGHAVGRLTTAAILIAAALPRPMGFPQLLVARSGRIRRAS